MAKNPPGGNRLVCLGYAAIPAALFAALTIAVITGAADIPDGWVMSRVPHVISPLTAVAYGFTRLGSIAVLAMLLAVAATGLWLASLRHAAVALVAMMVGALALENALKYAVQRARPESWFAVPLETYSFPSGHAMLSACLFGGLASIITPQLAGWRTRTAIWAACLLTAAGIGLSRIYLGFHYPSDVLGGYLAAAFWIHATTCAQRSGR